MANASGQSAAPKIDDLLSNGHEFTFPQVMRLARMHLVAGGRDELPKVPWQERVRVRPDLSFAFPAADVAKVERYFDGLLVTVTFLALYGSSSPLPTFYSEDLIDEASNDSSVSRDFLDIIHQRLYQLFFLCWSKYKLFIRVAEEKNPIDRERLFCLIGLGEKELRDSVPEAWSLLRYAGLLTQFPRSAEGLRTLLRDALGVKMLEVEQCVLRKVPIPADQRMSLGLTGMRLGVDTVLGSEISDRMGKFRILIGPLKKKDFDNFLPGRPQHDKLARLIRIYIIDPFDYDLKLILAANEAKPIRLGDPDGARLGFDSWCFSSKSLGEVTTTLTIVQSAAKAPDSVGDDNDSAQEPKTLVDYYQQELALLRGLVADFAKTHTELAPLVSGHMADPGVERLLEGTAFLWALLRMKLDDDFPEVIHKIMDVIQPNSLRPVPASTIIVFTPKPNLTEPQIIPAGTVLKSIPVDGTACRFTTRYPVEIHPLILTEANFAHPSGKPAQITLSLKLTALTLSAWKLTCLRLFLAGDNQNATNLFLLLTRYLKRIIFEPFHNGQSIVLDPKHLKPIFLENEELQNFSHGHDPINIRPLKEYFIQSERFLFLDLYGWEKWRIRGEGTGFNIRFEFDKLPFSIPKVSKSDFALFATPAMNVFDSNAKPINIEDQQERYRVLPQADHCEVFSVEKVTGVTRGKSQEIQFQLTELASRLNAQLQPVYHLTRVQSPMYQAFDTFISINESPKPNCKPVSLLSIDLRCTNGSLAEKLNIGDICVKTDSSPKFADFTNCSPVTIPMPEAQTVNHLWRLFSLNAINPSILNTNSLRAILKLVSHSLTQDYSLSSKHQKRIEGIIDYQIKAVDSLNGRAMLRGWEVRIKLNQDAFTSHGDMYLFGAIIDHFLRGFVSNACFTRTIVIDAQNGSKYEWLKKMGYRFLV